METIKKRSMNHSFVKQKTFRYSNRFSLIELLVVITIIAILAGLLLPVLGKARESSHSILCLSNEKQLIHAYSFYTDDFNGWIRPVFLTNLNNDVTTAWSTYLAQEQYGKTTSIQIGRDDRKYPLFTCPSESTPLGGSGFFYYGHYCVNALAAGTSFDSTAVYKPRQATSLTQPSNVLLLLDSVRKQNCYISSVGVDGMYIGLRHGNTGGGGGIEEDNTSKCYLFGRKVNAAYYDGHAKTLGRKDWEYKGLGIQRDLLRLGYINNYSL